MRHLTASLFITLLLLSACQTDAQPAADEQESYLSSQVVRLLSSSSQDSEATALHLIIYHESRDQQNLYNFKEATPQLVEIIEETRDEKQRILAETALHLTGEKKAR